jgi:hypothetical protein
LVGAVFYRAIGVVIGCGCIHNWNETGLEYQKRHHNQRGEHRGNRDSVKLHTQPCLSWSDEANEREGAGSLYRGKAAETALPCELAAAPKYARMAIIMNLVTIVRQFGV